MFPSISAQAWVQLTKAGGFQKSKICKAGTEKGALKVKHATQEGKECGGGGRDCKSNYLREAGGEVP